MQNPYVSIVSGTYNRVNSLLKMIDSARKSVGVGIPYEFVIVDGGSTDGTIEWCKKQKDIRLIEQGKLLGACKAFNEGAYSAKGKYVILANDDIEFRYESIQNSIAYMDDHLDCGIGCFPQNRLSPEYTVSKLPCVLDGKRVWLNYGQVCIVPKWLGDKVGWWGDYHTYAGDNELSCNVIELGLKVDALDSCCIDDHMLEDDLRKINNPVDHLAGGSHPDSIKWVNKWTRNGMLGPNVRRQPIIKSPLKREKRLIYAPLYEDEEFPFQLQTKHGLRDALSKHYLVSEINYRRNPDNLYYAISMFMPDVVLIQYHDYRHVTYDFMMKLKDEFPNTIFVSWNGDYSETVLGSRAYKEVAKLFDIASFVTYNLVDDYKEEGINYKFWQIGWEDYIPVPDSQIKKNMYDVLFLGNCYTPLRQELGHMLRFHKEWKTGLYGKWPSHIGSQGITQYDFIKGDALYRSSKIALSDNQYPKSIGYISNRVFQALHSGAFLLQQEIVGMTELLGFEDGKHLCTWSDFQDLEDKIAYWLDPRNEAERLSIAKEGKRFVDANYSFDRMVELFEEMIGELPMKKA